MSAIRAEYVTLKHIKGRDSYQIILEVPAMDVVKVTNALGFPTSHKSKWVGVALLNEEAVDPLAGTPDGLAG